MFRKIIVIFIISFFIKLSQTILPEENGKDLPNNFNQDDILDRKRRPISGSPGFINVGYNYNYNVNCGVQGSGAYPNNEHYNEDYGTYEQHHKPGSGLFHKPGGHHKPGSHHKPGHGGHHQGNGDSQGGYPQRPFFSMLFGNRPFATLSNSDQPNHPGVLNNIATSISGILPTPQEFGQGFGDGIASFIQTIPQIGQSFQSLLPDFSNFGPFGSGQTAGPNLSMQNPSASQNPLPVVPNDDNKPIHEDHDPVTDPFKHRLRPGRKNYYRNYRFRRNSEGGS